MEFVFHTTAVKEICCLSVYFALPIYYCLAVKELLDNRQYVVICVGKMDFVVRQRICINWVAADFNPFVYNIVHVFI
jgi:hypothetical protein